MAPRQITEFLVVTLIVILLDNIEVSNGSSISDNFQMRPLFDFRQENRVSTGFVSRGSCSTETWTRAIWQAMASRTLYSSCLSIFRNPNNMTHPAALGAFRAIPNSNYAFLPPFFLLSAKIFFAVFFLTVQVILTDDLQRPQFFTKPALNEHILFTSWFLF